MAKKRLATPKLRSTAIQQQSEYSESITPLNFVDEEDLEEADLEKLSEILKNANEAVSQHLLSALQAALIAGKALLAA
ncbi:MAG: hypothetical protein HC810_00845 [Acaryochloridaceae cyanobacterium RL_2_7]|nr:hypothetical protein [Acaryochloridaceae cyanobacterium RL_2_7]